MQLRTTDADADVDTHTHPDAHADTHPDADTHTHPDTDADTHPDADTHTHTHPDADANTDFQYDVVSKWRCVYFLQCNAWRLQYCFLWHSRRSCFQKIYFWFSKHIEYDDFLRSGHYYVCIRSSNYVIRGSPSVGEWRDYRIQRRHHERITVRRPQSR